jgi:hypothetical protein
VVILLVLFVVVVEVRYFLCSIPFLKYEAPHHHPDDDQSVVVVVRLYNTRTIMLVTRNCTYERERERGYMSSCIFYSHVDIFFYISIGMRDRDG